MGEGHWDDEHWDGVESLLVACADDDVEAGGEIGPALMAFTGAQLLFAAWLRPFERGAYHQPMIELLALAMPLGADRLALSVGGRAWSLDDPIPPVTGQADLRQRVHMLHLCDGTGEQPVTVSLMRPFDLDGSAVCWGRPQRVEGGVEGWVPQCLEVAIVTSEAMRGVPTADIAAQAARCDLLGHDLYFAPELLERLDLSDASPWTAGVG